MSSPTPAERDQLRALLAAGAEDAAEALARRWTRRYPASFLAWNAWGGLLGQTRQYSKAMTALQRATALAPGNPAVFNNLGSVLATLGDIPASIAQFRHALSLRPDYLECWSNLLFAQQCAVLPDPLQDLRDALAFADQARAGVTPFTAWRTPREPGPLRVGLVSGDLREHPVGYFLEGVCAQIDPAQVTLLAYPTHRAEDALTSRLRRSFSGWLPIDGLSDPAAAAQIHAQGPHILIDLAGHTAHNRLGLFAWRPAPVQVSWLGYVSTTGMREIDYLLADPVTVPPDAEMSFAERVSRLPDTRFCFTPPPASPDVAPLPAARHGIGSGVPGADAGGPVITFGSFNRLCKVQDDVLALWARVLHAVPASRLILMTRELSDPGVRPLVEKRLARCGLPRDRLTLADPLPRSDYLRAYENIDVILDTFPFAGGTTTAEALWMGVPVLTLQGRRMVERQGAGLLRAVGLDDWIADDTDQFVARARQCASDLAGLGTLRAGLRARLLASPVGDSARFARHLTQVLQDMVAQRARDSA